jgi:hypothetical protein
MGTTIKTALRVGFDRSLDLDFHGSKVSSAADLYSTAIPDPLSDPQDAAIIIWRP